MDPQVRRKARGRSTAATAEQLAASITFLLSDDGVNINGAIVPSDGGWSARRHSGKTPGGRDRSDVTPGQGS